MKRIHLLALLFVVFLQNKALAQTLEIEYILKFPKGQKAANSRFSDEEWEKNQSKFVSLTLTQANNLSVFKRSPAAKQSKDDYHNNMSVGYEWDVYYKDLKNQLLAADVQVLMKYQVSDQLPKYAWKLEKESQFILGYKCFKATMQDCTHEQTWVAWYCPQIPISNGPLHLGGLPGIILKLETENSPMSIVANSLHQHLEVCQDIKLPVYKKAMKLNEFCDARRKLLVNLKEKAMNGGF